MKENERKKMKENERRCKNMKENRTKENERNEKPNMKENRVPLQNVHYSSGNLESRPGGSLLSLGEEQTFSECALFRRKKGEPPREHPRATREGTARDLNLEKRDKYL